MKLLDRYLNIGNSRSAILINGKWGSGKTHFIRENFLKSVKDREVYYISLFGVESVSDIYKHIIAQKILKKQSNKIQNNSAILLSTVMKSGINLLSKKYGFDLDKDFRLTDFVSMNESLIVFDDLERVSEKVDLIELLGGISNSFLENENCKVVFIADETEIKDRNFKIYKEKIISFTIQIRYEPNRTINSIIDGYESTRLKNFLHIHKDFMIDVFESFELNNYRTVIFAIDTIEVLLNHLDEPDLTSVDDLIYSIIILAIEEKAGRFSEIIKEEEVPSYVSRGRGSESIKLSNDSNERHFNKYIVSRIRREQSYRFNYYFSLEIFKLIHFGIYSPEGINSNIQEIEDYVRNTKKSGIYSNIEKLQGFVYLSNEEFVKYYTDLLGQLSHFDKRISFQDLILSIKSIYYLGSVPQLRIDPEETIKKYIYPHLEEWDKSTTYQYIPRLEISRLDRAIGEISRYSSNLSERLDRKLKLYNDRYLYTMSKREIEEKHFNDVSEYNLRTYLNTASSEEIFQLVKSLEDEDKSINDFANLLDRTLKISINSYNEFSNEEVFAGELLKCLVDLRSNFELVEGYWLEQSIVIVENFLKK